jgi:hypothetical protein
MKKIFEEISLRSISVFIIKNILLAISLFIGLLYFIYAGEKIPVANVTIEFWMFCFGIMYLCVLIINLSVNITCDKYCSAKFGTKKSKFFVALIIIVVLMIVWYQSMTVIF